MSHTEQIHDRYTVLTHKIDGLSNVSHFINQPPDIIAVSKRQPWQRVEALLSLGHRHFGENQLQEAQKRWQAYAHKDSLTLHLIGPLQSNKVKEAVRLFDVIHTIDREKIALAVGKQCHEQGKSIPCFIQINTGEEVQKSGIAPCTLGEFLRFCKEEAGLDIIGLMAIPPRETPAAPHFALMQKLARAHDITHLSMGMSGDYPDAIRFGATYIRLGTQLFGPREEG